MSDPWVRFFPSDWLAGTRGMSAPETGVYITLVSLMYEKGQPIDRDDMRQARLVGMRVPAFRKILETLIAEKKISDEGGFLWNSRVGRELQNRAEVSEAARERAKARWEKAQRKQRPDNATALPTHSLSNANHNHNHNTPRSPQIDTVQVHVDDPVFGALTRLRGKRPIVGKNFTTTILRHEYETAKATLQAEKAA